MGCMTKDHPHSVVRSWGNRHDYLPAAGHDRFLPAYDLLTWVLGARPVYDQLVAQAALFDGARVLEVGAGTGNVTLRAIGAVPGADITALPMYRRAILGLGYLPQETSIFRGMTVEQNIAAVLELAEPDKIARQQRLD